MTFITTRNRSGSTKVQKKRRAVCCYNASDIIEWFICTLCISLAAILETGIIPIHILNQRPIYIHPDATSYSYPYDPPSINRIHVLIIALAPIFSFFIFNAFLLKISTFWNYQSELDALREIEINKNRLNKGNRLKTLNKVFNNKYDSKEVLLRFVTLTKSVFFTLGLTHSITVLINMYIKSPRPYYRNLASHLNSNGLDSFPSVFAADCMSVNCLLFLCMLHSFRSFQSVYHKHKYDQIINHNSIKSHISFKYASTNNQCFNGNAYFGSNLWFLLRDVRVLSIFLVVIPLMLAMYVGLTQIVEYQHFGIDVIAGFMIGGCVSFLSFFTFYDELVAEYDILSLSAMMKQIECSSNADEQAACMQYSNHKVYNSISSETMTKMYKKRKFPKNSVVEYAHLDNCLFAVNDDYNLRELEKMSLALQNDTKSILTDEDGVDIDDDDEYESEDDDDEVDELVSPDGSGSDTTLQSSLHKRKECLLNKHRNSIKLTLPVYNNTSKRAKSVDDNENGFQSTMSISPLSPPRYASSDLGDYQV